MDRVKQFNMLGLVWAFENDLFDTTHGFASLADYAAAIAEVH